MKLKYDVTGMTCAACSARVEKVTKQVAGVKNVEVNLLSGTMTLEAESEAVCPLVETAVKNAGYGASLSGERKKQVAPKEDAQKQMQVRIIGSAMFLAVLMYFTMGHMEGLPLPHWYHDHLMAAALLQLLLTLPVIYLNRSYFSRGFKALWHRSPNMDSLIAVGAGAALVYSIGVMFRIAVGGGNGHLYFESAAMILTLVTVGKFLETRAKGKTGDAIRQLMDLRPKVAFVIREGVQTEIPVEQVRVGDIVAVRSGGSIPVDGVIISGHAAIDQSALTGESVPVDMSAGDRVAAATTVTEGYIELRAEKVGEDTTLSQIIRLVEQAGGSKAPIARLADRISGVFVPVVMSIAAIVLLVWLLISKDISFALTSAIAVLVISCPCALGLATPVAIMVATGKAASMGILFKDAATLEQLRSVDTVVLDKTGTLTTGKPRVTDVLPNTDKAALMRVAAALERKSEHPFAKAIMEKAEGIAVPPAEDFRTLPGRGVCAVVEGKVCYGGNRRLMEELGVVVPVHAHLADQGKTPLYFTCDGRYLGAICAADVLKADAAEAVAQMKKLGLTVVMLTGDNEKTASAVAAAAGIDRIVADVLPADKAMQIRTLQQQGRKVLMVGDGINDAPALVTADVGMAIGAGTDVAMESARVVLMRNDLFGICHAYQLSKDTLRNIKQNLFWAFFYNALCIPIAAGALYPVLGWQMSPMLGAAAMSCSSVFVVSNALRLRFWRPKTSINKEESVKEEIKMETVIYVNGMMCPHCKANVEKACKSVAGVTDAVVDLQAKNVTVTGTADVAALKAAIVDAGYEIAE